MGFFIHRSGNAALTPASTAIESAQSVVRLELVWLVDHMIHQNLMADPWASGRPTARY
jgi:hypothetical protein